MQTFRLSLYWPATLAFLLLFSLACGSATDHTSGAVNPPSTQTPNSAKPINIATSTAASVNDQREPQLASEIEPTPYPQTAIPPSISPTLVATQTQSLPQPTPWAAQWPPPFLSSHTGQYNHPPLIEPPPKDGICPDDHPMCSVEYESTVWISNLHPSAYARMKGLSTVTDPQRVTQGDILTVAFACVKATKFKAIVEYQERRSWAPMQQTEIIEATFGYSEAQILLVPSASSRDIKVAPVNNDAQCWVGFRKLSGSLTYPPPTVEVDKRDLIWGQPREFVRPTPDNDCPDDEPMCKYGTRYYSGTSYMRWHRGHANTGDVLRIATHCLAETGINVEWRMVWNMNQGDVDGSMEHYRYSAPSGYHEEEVTISADVYGNFEHSVSAAGECWLSRVNWDGWK